MSVSMFDAPSKCADSASSVHAIRNYLFYFADDVAVIDEVQMIEDLQRGGAWTRALLGKFLVDMAVYPVM